MKRLIRNKKGILGLDNLTDIIGSAMQVITNIIPAPLLFIIFLFLIVAFASILSILFNFFGIYCNSAGLPVTLNGNIVGSIGLAGQTPDPKTLGQEFLPMEEWGISAISSQVTYCSAQFPNGVIYFNESQRLLITTLVPNLQPSIDIYNLITNPPDQRLATNFSTPMWFYDGTFCTDCQKVTVCDNMHTCTRKCLGDVTQKSADKKNILQKLMCGNVGCEPPKDYTYKQSRNQYEANNNNAMTKTIGTRWDELLSSKGATLLYASSTNTKNPSAESSIGITCSELKPRLAVFGVDLFTFNLWILITLFTILGWAFVIILTAKHG